MDIKKHSWRNKKPSWWVKDTVEELGKTNLKAKMGSEREKGRIRAGG